MFCFPKIKRTKIILSFLIILSGMFFYTSAKAAVLGEVKSFYVDPAYDLENKSQLSAQLISETGKIYFYIDNALWQLYSSQEKIDVINNLTNLSKEFENNIYPTLTSNYGLEPNPGVDNDAKITLLFHQMKRGAGGYFNSGNEYFKYEVPASNEREMLYLNSDYIASPLLKRLLAHEFTHLITFNQKEKTYNIEEDIWLNEARAEYAITLCGYDNIYFGSNLQKRVVEFLKNPNDALMSWSGVSADYGTLNIFTQYIADQYGAKILGNSLKMKATGIDSINRALIESGYKENFFDIFKNWTIAVFLNDCSFGPRYCYKNPNLKNLKVMPNVIPSPNKENPVIRAEYSAGPLSGQWNKISDFGGKLTVIFSGDVSGDFKVNYILCDKTAKCEIAPLFLDADKKGKLDFSDSKRNYNLLTIISFAQNDNINSYLKFSLEVESDQVFDTETDNSDLLAQIEDLKRRIEEIKALLANENQNNSPPACGNFSRDLYFGMSGSSDVSCLQRFLKNQGADIYPEGLITGNFFNKTKQAVVRFQEKYAGDILKPLGLNNATGYVGLSTRTKINSLLP